MAIILKGDTAERGEASFGARWTERLILFAAAPGLLGFIFGWIRIGRARDWPLPSSLAFWLTMSLVLWLMLDLGTRIAAWSLRRWRPSLTTVLVAGALIGVFLMVYAAKVVIIAFQDLFVPPTLHRPLPENSASYLVHSYLVGVILWVLTNLGLVRLLAVPRFGFGDDPPPPPAEPARHADPVAARPSSPAFLSRLERPVGRLLAIMAEQHYLRVIGSEGDDLILYRISDAVRELAGGGSGLQVHRSYWVARDAVTGAARGRSGPVLVLSNGLQVPVGRTFRSAAVAAGLLDHRLAVPFAAGEPISAPSRRDDPAAAASRAHPLVATGPSEEARAPADGSHHPS